MAVRRANGGGAATRLPVGLVALCSDPVSWRLLAALFVTSLATLALVAQFLLLALATSHPGIAGEVMIAQRGLAVLGTGLVAFLAAASANLRRRLSSLGFSIASGSALLCLGASALLVSSDGRE